jgi:hypothetical protein
MAAINALDHMATPQRDELHPHEDPRIDATVPCAASYERLRWPHSVVTYLPAFWVMCRFTGWSSSIDSAR